MEILHTGALAFLGAIPVISTIKYRQFTASCICYAYVLDHSSQRVIHDLCSTCVFQEKCALCAKECHHHFL
jgi:hypothetical protein